MIILDILKVLLKTMAAEKMTFYRMKNSQKNKFIRPRKK